MKFIRITVIFLTIFMVVTGFKTLQAIAKPSKSADTVLINGYVYTVDEVNPVAEAVAIKDGKIIYVGNGEGAATLIGVNTEVIDLAGKMVLPSFVDAHMHPAMSGVTYLYNVVLYDVFDHDSYIAKIQAFVDDSAHDSLPDIQGMGFLKSVYSDINIYGVEGPIKDDLDAIESERPVAITSADGHSMWVNSKALELAGITAETEDPLNGIIMKDVNTGEPTGFLKESAASLVSEILSVPTKEQYKEGLLMLNEMFNAVGVTACHDAWVGIDSPDYYEAYEELAREGQLSVRYRGSWYLNPEMDVPPAIDNGLALSKKFKTPYWQVSSFKFFADEVIEEATGLLNEPYTHRDDEWYGIKDWEDDALKAAYQKVDAAGFQIHTHQIGDGAARYALDALEYVRNVNGERDSRHSFAHIQMMDPEDVLRMADLKVNAITAPYWMVIDDYFWDLYLPFLGPERAYNEQYPMQSLFQAGVNVAVHSDFSVSEPDPMYAIYSGMTRCLPQKIFDIWYADWPMYVRIPNPNVLVKNWNQIGALPPLEERATLEQMIHALTIGGAFANFLENEIGTITAGKIADLVVLEKNLFAIDVEEIADVQILMTFFEGKKVFEKE